MDRRYFFIPQRSPRPRCSRCASDGTHVRLMTVSESGEDRKYPDDMHVSGNAGGRMLTCSTAQFVMHLNGPHADVTLRHSLARHRLLDAPSPPALSRKPIPVLA